MSITAFAFAENDTLASSVASHLPANFSCVDIHRFPDRESCVRIKPDDVTDVCIVFASLNDPDVKTLSLIFLSETLRDYGAERIILVAPYLSYMRQDKRFKEGEGVTAQYYARLISKYYDALITVDPHLHRIHNLNDIYSIPTKVLHAAPVVADWIKDNIENALLIGPDSESEQWVSDLSQRANTPFIVLEKTRYGDHEVCVSVPHVEEWLRHQPVLFDDIISTGKTMIETITHLKNAGLSPPLCIGIHAVFSDQSCQELQAAGTERIITTNTIPHSSNAIDISQLIVDSLKELLKL